MQDASRISETEELKSLVSRINVDIADGYIELCVDGEAIYGMSPFANDKGSAALRRFSEVCEAIAGRRPPPPRPFNNESLVMLRAEQTGECRPVISWGEFKDLNADGIEPAELILIEDVIRHDGAWYMLGGGAAPVMYIAKVRS